MHTILPDTNAITALFRGDTAVLDALARADRVLASAIVLGELEAGFRGGTRYAQNFATLEQLLTRPTVEILPVTRETADCFGRLKDTLRRQGRPIPINDLWIAAGCMETGAVLVTYDTHFQNLPPIRVWNHI